MQLIALKEDYSICKILNPINVQWSRQYYEAGAFLIQISYDEFDADMHYIFRKDRKEFGIISKINYSASNGNKLVQISGNFAEKKLDDCIICPSFAGRGAHADVVLTDMFRSEAWLILHEYDIAEAEGFATSTDYVLNEIGLAEGMYSIAKLHEMTFTIEYDHITKKKKFYFWQGLDRTQGQNINQPVVFSMGFRNLVNPDVCIDKEHKNYAYVKGSYNNENIYVEADAANDYRIRREVIIDGSSVEFEEGMGLEEYRTKLQKYGLQVLANEYSSVTNVAFDVDLDSYTYGVDWDLGDKVTVKIEDMGLVLEARIISVYEVYKDNRLELSVEFGNQKIK